jgi:hypothetical protein
MNIQDFFLAQIVSQGEMDQIYADAEAAEHNMSKEANLGQTTPVGPVGTVPNVDTNPGAEGSGGILFGLVVTKNAAQVVDVSPGAARDSDGERIVLPALATVSLVNLGDTPEGDITNATGDGAITASSIAAGEAWLSLFIVKDTNLSDVRIDGLGNSINFRQTESFHFELLIGVDAATAIDRPPLNTSRILLADILLDNNGDIRVITAIDAIATSTRSLADIGYGPDDTANLTGRRSDWVAIDYNNSTAGLAGELTTWRDAAESGGPNGKAYTSIRGGDPRLMVRQLMSKFSTFGTASIVAGSELIGGKETTGSVRTSPVGNSLDFATATSIHDQLVALKDKVNTLLSRGTDTFTGNLTLVGNLVQTGDLTVTGLSTLDNTIVDAPDGSDGLTLQNTGDSFDGKRAFLMTSSIGGSPLMLGLRKYGIPEIGSYFFEDFSNQIETTISATITDHFSKHRWSQYAPGPGTGSFKIAEIGTSSLKRSAAHVVYDAAIGVPALFGMVGPKIMEPGAITPVAILLRYDRSVVIPAQHRVHVGISDLASGFAGIQHSNTGIFGLISGASGSTLGVVNLDPGAGTVIDIIIVLTSSSTAIAKSAAGSESLASFAGGFNTALHRPYIATSHVVGVSSSIEARVQRMFMTDARVISGL